MAAIVEVAPGLAAIAAYLACLLRGDKSEFLAFDDGRAVFLSLDALEEEGAAGLKAATRSFMTLRHLCTFSETKADLLGIVARYRDRLADYGEQLVALAGANAVVGDALASRDTEAKTYMTMAGTSGGRHTVATLRDLRRLNDFATLKRLAIRSCDDPDAEVRREAQRGSALVDARSSVKDDRDRAVSLLGNLCDSPEASADDFASLINLLVDLNQLPAAKERIRAAIGKFPAKAQGFAEIGMPIVQQTGDRDFRDELLQRRPVRGA